LILNSRIGKYQLAIYQFEVCVDVPIYLIWATFPHKAEARNVPYLERKISENPNLDLGKFPGKDIEIVFRKFVLSSIGRHFSFIFRNISPTSINPT